MALRSGKVVDDGSFRAPHPWRAAAVIIALALLPVALWSGGLLPQPVALGFAVSIALLGLGQGGLGIYERRRSRELGDALLRAYPGLPPVSGLAAWRSRELSSARARRALARGVGRLGRETEACLSVGSPRVDRTLLETILRLARKLEYRLDLVSEPVTATGMLDVEALTAAPRGPRSCPERAGELPAALDRALTALEPER